jgi:ABC-type nickel/cobalt efflux system permease component RcnA
MSHDCSSALQVHKLIDDALHHVSAGAACPHRHAVSLERLGQPGQEGALVISFLSCGLVGC